MEIEKNGKQDVAVDNGGFKVTEETDSKDTSPVFTVTCGNYVIVDRPGRNNDNRHINHRQGNPVHSGDVITKGRRLERQAPKDEGWGWVIVFASFLVHFLAVSGAHKSFGVLFVEFQRKFQATSQATAWISSLAQFMALSMGPMAGLLATRVTPRGTVAIGSVIITSGFIISMFAPNIGFLYFSYGIIVGLGTAFTYSPTITTLGQYFEKRRALANGLGAAGAGVGSLSLPPLLTYLLQEYSISGTLLIMAGLMLNLLVCAALLRSPEFYTKSRIIRKTDIKRKSSYGTVDNGFDNLSYASNSADGEIKQGANSIKVTQLSNQPDNQMTSSQTGDKEATSKSSRSPRKFQWSAIKQPVVYVYGVSILFLYCGLPVVLMFLPSLGISLGLSDSHAALLLSLQGAGDLCGRVLFGALADMNLIPKMYYYIFGGLISGVAAIIMLFVGGNLVALCILAFMFGAGAGNIFGLIPPLMADGLVPELLQSGFSILTVFMGLPFLFAPAIGGQLEDMTKSWDATFYFTGTCIIIGSLVPLVMLKLDKEQKTRQIEP